MMESVDNAVLLVIRGATDEGATNLFFWAIAAALAVTCAASFPVNRSLMARGMGRAHAMEHHGHH